jgi:hypothetical protein
MRWSEGHRFCHGGKTTPYPTTEKTYFKPSPNYKLHVTGGWAAPFLRSGELNVFEDHSLRLLAFSLPRPYECAAFDGRSNEKAILLSQNGLQKL